MGPDAAPVAPAPTVSLPVARPDLGADELAAIAAVFESGWLGRGPRAEQFEREIAGRTGAPYVVAVSTGTAALELAIEALGIGPGDEVIVPSLTFCASYQAIVATGARPVFAEIDPHTLCLDAADAERRITRHTRAVMTVHFAGFAGGRTAVADVAAAHGLHLVEDAAHAFGSQVDGGLPVGGTGNPVCFSFDPIKTLTCGQGGAVATADADLAERLRLRSDLGLAPSHVGPAQVVGPGHRFAMSDLNAAIGLAQLSGFDRRAERRRAIVRRYAEEFRGLPGVEVAVHDVSRMVPFMFPVRVPAERRHEIRAALESEGVGTGMHYLPGHLHQWFAGHPALPVTERVGSELVTLPLTPTMSDDDVDRVVGTFDRAVRHRYSRPGA